MKKRSGFYPCLRTSSGRSAVVAQAGGVLLTETIRKSGLDTALSAALAPWRKDRAVHDPGKILLDVALAVALGGDCLADVAMLRAQPAVFGPVASDPTVSRLIDTLAKTGPKALAAIRAARAEVRQRVWWLAGEAAPAVDGQVTVDIDGVLVVAHSEKEDAAATWKKTFGHHPLMGFADHGRPGSGEPVAALLRPGNAGSNTALPTTRTSHFPYRYAHPAYRESAWSAYGHPDTLSDVNSENTRLLAPAATARRFTVLLSATPRGARLARWLSVRQLDDWGQPHGTAEQIVAELAANAALHGRLPGRNFRLALSLTPPATLRIAVSDPRPERLPLAPGDLDADAESGRGLLIVAALADRWGVDLALPPLKTVWAELDQAGAHSR